MAVNWLENPRVEFQRLPTKIKKRIRRVSPRATACWIWLGPLHVHGHSGEGYGRQYWEGFNWLAHRLVYTLLIGTIPEGLVLDHLRERCTSKACVRPDHVEPVTSHVNNARGGGWFGNKFRKIQPEPEEEVPF